MRCADAASRGKLLGIGIGCYVEVSATPPMSDEFGSVRIDDTGAVHILVGTSSHGQGHATVFAQIASDIWGTGNSLSLAGSIGGSLERNLLAGRVSVQIAGGGAPVPLK